MKFFDLFPTPRYLSLAEAGISISERAIHYISLKSGLPGEFKVIRSGSISLPEGVIQSGAIGDKAALALALTKLRSEQGFNYVSVSLPEEKGYLYTTTVDKVDYKDLYDAVAFTVEENVPVTLNDSIFAFEALPQAENVKASVSVLPLAVAKDYEEVLKSAGLTPVSVYIEPQAIGKALVKRGDTRSHLIVNLNERKTGFYLVDDEVVQFSSTISLDLKAADAVQTLKSEIRKFFVFWNTRLDQAGGPRKIEHIVLCGEAAADDALTANIMVDVETPYSHGNVWTNVCPVERHLPDMPFDASLSYAGAIGAILPESKHAYV